MCRGDPAFCCTRISPRKLRLEMGPGLCSLQFSKFAAASACFLITFHASGCWALDSAEASSDQTELKLGIRNMQHEPMRMKITKGLELKGQLAAYENPRSSSGRFPVISKERPALSAPPRTPACFSKKKNKNRISAVDPGERAGIMYHKSYGIMH
jgi:hypothetical protein